MSDGLTSQFLSLKALTFSFMTNVNKDDELALVIINLKFYFCTSKMSHCLFFSSQLLLLLEFTDTDINLIC